MSNLAAYRDPKRLAPNATGRIAKLLQLGAEAASSELAMANMVGSGFPVSAALALEPILGRARLTSAISASTLRRGADRPRLTRDPSQRIYDLGRVIDQAALTFGGDEAAVLRFLDRPNSALNGQKPFEVARNSSPGAELVVLLLREADAGVAL